MSDELLYALHSTGQWTLFELARNFTMAPSQVAEALKRISRGKVLAHSFELVEGAVEGQRVSCN